VSGAERAMISRAFARLDPVALGAGLGVVSGTVLFLMTATLVLRGGIWVGMHLGRLSNYLPGYTVSWPGALIGAIEGGAAGFIVGTCVALLWNAYHHLFIKLVIARERRRALRRVLEDL
jgi:hypothetical protein